VITQTAKELKIQREGSDAASVYALDGSESSNTGPRGGTAKSKSRWDGAALVTEGDQTMTTPNGEFTMKFKETRSLAEDGSMVVVRVSESPRGEQTRKTVYKKKP
jgi:hypothetical protein